MPHRQSCTSQWHNDALGHVTFAAGLGGRWGPYRLDVGQKLVQVSEDKKQGLDEATKRKAQQMADEAYRKRQEGT